MIKQNYHLSCKLAILLVTILAFASSLVAQESNNGDAVSDKIKDLNIEIPFIDRDGDGINDLLQNGWGLRFLKRYQKRQLVWEQLNVEIIRSEDGLMVDTNGDGKGDVAFHDFMKQKMDELIDTDGDGKPDTPLKDYLGRRFKAYDKNGDGLPDDFNREEMKNFMKQMREWRQSIHDRIRQGLPPFIDQNNDGVPDNLPEAFFWRGHPRKGGP